MKIELAYPYENHKPDSVIEVDDELGRQMIHDGSARPHTTSKSAPASAPKDKEA